MTLQFKLIILAIIAGLFVASNLWSLNKGIKIGKADCQIESVKALKKSMEEQERKFHDQREAEMRDAAEVAKGLRANENKLKVQNNELKQILKRKENEILAATVVPADVIIVLNSTRGSTSPEPEV